MKRENFEKSVRLPKTLLGWAGLYISPKKESAIINRIKSWIFYFYLGWLGPMLLGELWWMIDAAYTGQNFDDLCTNAPCFTICILAIVKFNCLYFNRDVVEKVVQKLKTIHPTEEESSNHERRIIKNSSKFLRTVMRFSCYSSIVVVIVFGCTAALSMVYDYVTAGATEYKFPFRVKYFFEISSLSQWMLIYIYHVGAMLIVCADLVGTDLLFYAFCTYLQMHFRLLCLQFENVVSKDKAATQQNFYKAVRRHQELIELVEQIELLYSKSTLCNIMLSSLLICLSGFVVTFVQDIGAVASFVTFLSMNLSQISLLCYFGDMLRSASTRVFQAVYNSLWYDAGLDIQKSVRIVIIRAQKPCKVTAMKYADLNLNALSAILRTSWSYFALLKTMYD